LNILFIGDIMGRPGRSVVSRLLPELCHELDVEFVIANGENIAGGKGIKREQAREMFQSGVDVLTGGNHSWQNREGIGFLNEESRVLRPANYPENPRVPGRGFGLFKSPDGPLIGVINLQGRVFMPPLDCPFHRAQDLVDRLREQTALILVDFHAEATSEKVAMGWFLDGLVSAVIGTHTHVQTADEKILPNGTAYITDAGMTGPHDGVIGVKKEIVLETMLTRLPMRHKLAMGDLRLNAVLIQIDVTTGQALSIKRLNRKV